MWKLQQVQTNAQRAAAGDLIAEYLHWINTLAQHEYGLQFDIDAMLLSDIQDASKFSPPLGRFYLAQQGDQVGGVGCLKQLQGDIAEMQRMYVRPAFRGQGLGRLIAERLIGDARQIGYKALRLESLRFLTTAHELYRSLGFFEIVPYAENSMQAYQPKETMDAYQTKVVFMELTL
jgi:GNAT superfamily N-acetyltransferase